MSQAPERVQRAISNLRADGPRGDRRSLTASSAGRGDGAGSFRATLIRRACEEHGHSLDEPGEIEEYYFSDMGIIAIDLNPGE